MQGNNNSLSGLPSTDDQCPPWSFYNRTNKRCECYSRLNAYTDDIVKCTENGILLRVGFCMTFKERDGFYIGLCNYFDLSKYNVSDTVNYISLPRNVSELNKYICAPLKLIEKEYCVVNVLMGIDTPSHLLLQWEIPVESVMATSPGLYTYFSSCFKWLWCISVFYFRNKFNRAPLMVFVLHSQIQVSSYLALSNIILDANIALLWRVLIVFYGIFNLDFFRYILPAFCVSPSLKAFQVAFLDYILLVYLLLLFVFTWICIKLHSKHARLIVWLCNKLNQLLVHINARWDKLVDVFVIVLFLSFASLVFTSIWIAIPHLVVWNAKNFSVEQQFHVYLDLDIEYYNGEHLPFILVSSFITYIIILPLPILLALYPIKCFRSLLFRWPIISRHMSTINVFLTNFITATKMVLMVEEI